MDEWHFNGRPTGNEPILTIQQLKNYKGQAVRFLALARREENEYLDWSHVICWKYVGELPYGVKLGIQENGEE